MEFLTKIFNKMKKMDADAVKNIVVKSIVLTTGLEGYTDYTRLITKEDLVGKTITGVYIEDEEMFLSCSDHTYCHLYIEENRFCFAFNSNDFGYLYHTEYNRETEKTTYVTSPLCDMLEVDKDKVLEDLRKRADKAEADAKAYEYRRYLELKAKFEGEKKEIPGQEQ